MSGEPLAFTLELSAPPATVFAVLTEARDLRRWFCDECVSEPRAGGALVLRWTRPGGSPQPFVARWVEWEPPVRASFEGGHSGYPDGTAGRVRYVTEPGSRGGTRLLVSHEIPAGEAHVPFVQSWREAWPRALARLERYLSADTSA